MMMTMIAIVNGAALAGLCALLIRVAGVRYRMMLHTSLLLLAAVLYVVFAARAEAWGGMGIELVGTVVFGGMAVEGLRRRSAGLLALGWALHPVWDVALHSVGSMAAYPPEGYVAACIGFDLLLAVLIARGWAALPAPAPAAA